MPVSVENFALETLCPATRRQEARRGFVRIVEYTPFPRVGDNAAPRIGFTRDLSRSGMCIGADAAEPVGALLRVTLREVDGDTARTAVERVVWCSPTHDGRYWIGLESLTGKHSR